LPFLAWLLGTPGAAAAVQFYTGDASWALVVATLGFAIGCFVEWRWSQNEVAAAILFLLAGAAFGTLLAIVL
jgi:hypothetical protein